jgi:hypothetical protein
MLVEELHSTADLRRVVKQMRRRVVRLHCEERNVQVTYCAGVFKARLAGGRDVAFGETPSEVTQRLPKLLNIVCVIKPYDKAFDRAEARAARTGQKAARRSVRYAPKGNR